MDALKRWAVLLLAALVGLAAAVGYGFATWPKIQDSTQEVSKSDAEFIAQGAIFEVCVVFFAVTYLSGRGWARLFRSRALAEEIRRNSAWHMRLLLLLAVLLAAQRGWFVGRRGSSRLDDWVAIGFAVAFGALAVVFEVGRLRQSRES